MQLNVFRVHAEAKAEYDFPVFMPKNSTSQQTVGKAKSILETTPLLYALKYFSAESIDEASCFCEGSIWAYRIRFLSKKFPAVRLYTQQPMTESMQQTLRDFLKREYAFASAKSETEETARELVQIVLYRIDEMHPELKPQIFSNDNVPCDEICDEIVVPIF